MMDDLLIRGGHVIDGTGAPGFDADVSVGAGRIVAVERRASRPARRVIDARGQVVAPGLIDIHTHSDFTLPLNPRAESKIRQGVTLEVVGNCGFSAAPALPDRVEMLREYLAPSAPSLPFAQATFADYIAGFPATSVSSGSAGPRRARGSARTWRAKASPTSGASRRGTSCVSPSRRTSPRTRAARSARSRGADASIRWTPSATS
ncbi:MAG: hypothetical protein DMD87_03165 [Candidatus Rokuibacteriota bacterium]|nr:MAG: hypothetical protein DMD87_03165 [Candidatus Rokubacteria bacterium]